MTSELFASLVLVSSADNFYKQFWPRSGMTKLLGWSGSKLFDTEFPERFFRKSWFWKKPSKRHKSMKNFPGGAKIFILSFFVVLKMTAYYVCYIFSQALQNTLTLYLLVLSADSFCKQFETRLGPTQCRAWSGSKLFATLMVLLKEFFEKAVLEKNQQTTKKHEKLPKGQSFKVKLLYTAIYKAIKHNIYY